MFAGRGSIFGKKTRAGFAGSSNPAMTPAPPAQKAGLDGALEIECKVVIDPLTLLSAPSISAVAEGREICWRHRRVSRVWIG